MANIKSLINNIWCIHRDFKIITDKLITIWECEENVSREI